MGKQTKIELEEENKRLKKRIEELEKEKETMQYNISVLQTQQNMGRKELGYYG